MLSDKLKKGLDKTVCLSTAYLAPVEYFIALANANTVLLEKCEWYEKQTFRNRCYIAGANGKMALSIPIEKAPDGKKILTRDVRVSQHNDWQIQHWRSIESAYNSTPFFEYYKDDLLPFYEKKWNFLWDFNAEIQAKVFELLDLDVSLQDTVVYSPVLEESICDLRNSIHPKADLNAEKFTPYYQVFEQKFDFIPNLSIVDLLFNMGNESQLLILNS